MYKKWNGNVTKLSLFSSLEFCHMSKKFKGLAKQMYYSSSYQNVKPNDLSEIFKINSYLQTQDTPMGKEERKNLNSSLELYW